MDVRTRTVWHGIMALGAGAATFLVIFAVLPGTPDRSGSQPTFLNDDVLEIMATYPSDGSFEYLNPREDIKARGCTQDVYYGGALVAKGDPKRRSYCIGLMFEVYMRACERYAQRMSESGVFRLGNLGPKSFEVFRRSFYGVTSTKTLVAALTGTGLGIEVSDLERVRPGDFVQFWRQDGSGHAALFLGWKRDAAGNITALQYWSSQIVTGIGRRTETIGNLAHDIDPERVWFVRAFVPQLGRPVDLPDIAAMPRISWYERFPYRWVSIGAMIALIALCCLRFLRRPRS